MRLGEKAQAFGCAFEAHEETESTNSTALGRAQEAGRSGAPLAPLWIVAHRQSRGRGRMGREWRSPAGNLYATLLLIDPCPRAKAPELGFVAGLAAYEAVGGALLEAGVRAAPPLFGLKWPNDLLYDRAKCAGILLEAEQLADGRFAVAVGIGVNCRSHPSELPYPATSLAAVSPQAGDASALFAQLTDRMAEYLNIWRNGANFAAIRSAWLDACLGRGGEISVSQTGQTRKGRFETIDDSGRLILAQGKETIRIDAGDIFL